MTVTFEPGKSPDDVVRALKGMRDRLANLQPVLDVQGEQIRKLISDSFRQSRSPDGSPWAPNAQSTIDRKGSAKPGIDTRVLENSVAVTAGRVDITLGTNIPYAGANQFGATVEGTLKHNTYDRRTMAGVTKSGGVSKKKVRISGPTRMRPEGTPWKREQPARPFLPFTVAGTLITIGPSERVFNRLARAVGVYITTGKIT